jgi:hypothetical protein
MNQLNFFQRREFGEIVGFAFQFVKQNFIHYFVNILLLNLPIVALLIGGGAYMFQNANLEDFLSAFRFGGVGAILGFLVLFFIFVLVWASYVSAISYNYYLLYIEKGAKKFSLQELFSASIGSMFRVLAANFVVGLIVLLVIIIFGAIVGGTGSGVIAVLLGLALSVVAIIYAVRILFFQIVVIREKLGAFAAISRSFQIIKGYWWQTFGLMVVFGIISYLISNIVNLFLELLGLRIFDATSFMGRELPQIGTGAIIIFAIVQVITSVLSNIFSQTALFAQYGNLLEIKEGIGLKDKVEKIGETQDNDQDEEDF